MTYIIGMYATMLRSFSVTSAHLKYMPCVELNFTGHVHLRMAQASTSHALNWPASVLHYIFIFVSDLLCGAHLMLCSHH